MNNNPKKQGGFWGVTRFSFGFAIPSVNPKNSFSLLKNVPLFFLLIIYLQKDVGVNRLGRASRIRPDASKEQPHRTLDLKHEVGRGEGGRGNTRGFVSRVELGTDPL